MTTDVTPLVDIEVEHEAWLDELPDAALCVQKAIETTFAHMQVTEQLDIVVLLADDAELKSLNKEFRQKNAPTNVLSFPAPEMMHPHLGDMALGFETCLREASEQGKTLKDHLMHLSVHGALHLLGYDHIIDAEAEDMESLERDILKGLGIADPYAYGTTD
ncbi:rRNA maturation RNase YbeY [Asticcacaulis tiandongensis]|uniref:rRNA maturation RNase YbeY n=1 Tax=Asticcacaulis tiandongensis TaxID=2565365 RepID=UPI001126A32F|nr:rRNA maturation RNase YbeY [Asticcacaulis tiandongensis]